MSQADVERRLGWSRRYLSKILNGSVNMSLAHLYDVLDAAEIPPREFFCRLCGEGPPRASLDDVLRRLAYLEEQARSGAR